MIPRPELRISDREPRPLEDSTLGEALDLAVFDAEVMSGRRRLDRIEYRARYLRSPRWRATCRRIIAARGRRCEDCGASSRRLDVHHLTYERIGAELDTDLLVVCRRCHDKRHGRRP